MNLADLIASGLSARIATATHATVATDEVRPGPRVASVATVSVAKPAGRVVGANSTDLAALVRNVGAAWAFSPAEVDEALTHALAKPDEARECFEALAVEAVMASSDPDDRIRCRDCRNLRLTGVCLAATHLKAARTFSPDPMLPRRCEAFVPMPDNPDQRSGADRWGNLDGKAANA